MTMANATKSRFERFRMFLRGPWKHDGQGSFIFDVNGGMVAEIRGWGNLTGTGGFGLSDEYATEIQKARGDLLSVAPEMYVALERLLEDYEAMCGDGMTESNAPTIVLHVRSLLAQARGEL